jgi:hypothetical protein
MAKRTVKIGLMTYTNAKGDAGCVGFRGDEVDVHADDVERFDELNENPGGDEPYEPQRAEVSLISPGAGPELSGTGSGLNTVVDEDSDDAKSTAEQDAKKADLKAPKPDEGKGRSGGTSRK